MLVPARTALGAAIVAANVASCAYGALVMASSRLQRCADRGADSRLDCNEELVVTLALRSGTADAGVLEAVVGTQVEDADGRRVEMATDPATGLPVSRILIALAKTNVYLYYPTVYRKTFTFRAYEDIVYTGGTILSRECDESPTSNMPTCGWRHHQDGSRIEDSQGFCCICRSFENYFWADALARGSQTCSLFSSQGSAHCLRFDPLQYHAFEIGSAIVDYRVRARIRRCVRDSCSDSEIIELSHSHPLQRSAAQDVAAEIVGDFATGVQFPVLSSQYLFAPDSRSSCTGSTHRNCTSRLVDTPSRWLLLDKHHVDESGLTCNKIGVGYTAFRMQSRGCDAQRGACLRNQVGDFFDEAFASLRDNRCRHLVQCLATDSVVGIGVEDSAAMRATPGAANWRLMLESAQTHSTVVTLNIRADDIVWTQNVHSGVIYEATASKFEQNAAAGQITVIVINNGQCRSTAPDCQAQFTVGVPDCSSAIRPIQARTLSLRPNDPTTLSFILQAETDLYAPGSSYYCHVVLTNALGDEEHRVTVWFNTTATLIDRLQPSQPSEPAGSTTNAPRGGKACLWFDIFCYADSGFPLSHLASLVVMGVVVLMCCSCGASCVTKMPAKGAGVVCQAVRAVGQVAFCAGLLLLYLLRGVACVCRCVGRRCCGHSPAVLDEDERRKRAKRKAALERRRIRRLRRAQRNLPREMGRAASDAIRRGSVGVRQVVDRVRGSSVVVAAVARTGRGTAAQRSLQARFDDSSSSSDGSDGEVQNLVKLIQQRCVALAERDAVYLHLDAEVARAHQMSRKACCIRGRALVHDDTLAFVAARDPSRLHVHKALRKVSLSLAQGSWLVAAEPHSKIINPEPIHDSSSSSSRSSGGDDGDGGDAAVRAPADDRAPGRRVGGDRDDDESALRARPARRVPGRGAARGPLSARKAEGGGARPTDAEGAADTSNPLFAHSEELEAAQGQAKQGRIGQLQAQPVQAVGSSPIGDPAADRSGDREEAGAEKVDGE